MYNLELHIIDKHIEVNIEFNAVLSFHYNEYGYSDCITVVVFTYR